MSSNEDRLRALLLRSLEGDDSAYRVFLAELSGILRAFLRRRLTRALDEVEDLVQECLIAVHNQRHTYEPAQPVTAWLYAIARYKLVDLLRRHGRRDLLHDSMDDVPELPAAEDREAADARRDLAKLLDTLPQRQRMPIDCVKLQGLSVAEAARALGMSESAVKVGIHRGLKALMKRIGDER